MASTDTTASTPPASKSGKARPPLLSPPTGARKYITWGALAMMTTGSVASLRSAPTMAVFGLASVFLYVVPAIVFLIPTSLVSAELASGWKGGVYNWVSEGISAPMGLLAIWCQFAMTIFYYPALLAYVASTLAYIVDPSLANSGIYTAAVIVILFWGSVLVSSRGIRLIAKVASNGTIIGTLIPGTILVVMGVIYLLQGNHSAAPMNSAHLLPAWTGLAGIVLIVNNFLAYAGMEMNAVHVDQLRNPAREFPKSILLATILVLLIFIVPALTISWVIPSQQLSLTAGVMQAFTAFFAHFGLHFLVPLTAIALVVASLSGMIAWLAGPSKGLLEIGREYGYLPPYFQKLNADGIQMHILIAVGIVTTVIGLLYAFIPKVSSAYWIFSVMTTQVYLVMYVLMFIAAVKLRQRQPEHARGYRAPGLIAWCWIGGLASIAAIVIGFVPPSQFASLTPVGYGFLVLGGVVLIGLLPPLLLYRLRKPSWKGQPAAPLAPAPAAAAEPAAPAVPAPAVAATPSLPAAGAPTPATPAAAVPAGKVAGLGDARRHRIHVWSLVALLVLVAAAAVLIFKQGRNTHLAQTRADRLTALFVAHHLVVPVDHKTLIAVLGTNGGPVCASPSGALIKALKDQQFMNGAATVGIRPTRSSRLIVQGELLVLQVYCPKQLPAFRRFVNSNRYYNVASG